MNLVASVKRILLTACAFAVGLYAVQGQNTPLNQVTIASPTAASLGKYADIPVSYHTGIPDIDIPLYTIKEGPLTVPVSISYHSGGLKVLESSNAVGAGWALNAGGVISRTVRGAPDDRGLNAAPTKYGYFHDYGYWNYLFTPSGGSCGPGSGCPVGASYPANDAGIANQILDGEPDLYFFNFNGYTGKFYFNDDRTPVLVPQQDLKIEPIVVDESSSVAWISMPGFIITTPDGTKYYFGKNQEADGSMDAVEETYSMNSHTTAITSQGAVSSWFLTKITTADDQFSVKFLYQPDKYSYHTLSMFPVWNANGFTFNSPYGSYEYDLAKNFINGVKLQQIVFSNGSVTFNNGLIRNDVNDYYFRAITDQPNHEATSLGSISINGPDNFCKKFSFTQSYFVDNTSPNNGFYVYNYPIQNDRYRLRLDAVQEQSCDGSITVPPYRFSYYDDGGTDFAPRRLTFGQDHWGFYNGAVSNQTLVPTYWENYVLMNGADRDAHWPAMRIGNLKRITYPMGGYTDLDFEPNDTYGTIFSQQANTIYQRGVGNTQNDTHDAYTITITGDLHEISMDNDVSTASGSVASFELENSDHNIVYSLSVDPGKSKTATFIKPAGTYTAHLYKTTPGYPSGHGASATIKEIKQTSTTGNIMVGGLRIKSSAKHDAVTNNTVVTNYNYTVIGGTRSSGILYSRPVYVSLVRNDINKVAGQSANSSCSQNGCLFCDASTAQCYYKSGGEIFPMVTTQGNHIGYQDVKVSQTGNGYTRYQFYGSAIWADINKDIVTRSINNTTCDPNTPNFPAAPLPFEYKRGDLKYEGHFTEAGKAIAESYYYPEYQADKIKTPGTIVCYISTPGGTGPIWGTEYDLQTYRKVSEKVTSYTIDPATNKYLSSTTSKYFGSAFHNMPTRNEMETSTGDTLVTKTKYALDFRLSNCDMDDGWNSYANAYNNTVATFNSNLNCTNPPIASFSCRYIAYQQFRFDRSIARKNYLNYRRTNFTDPGNTFSVNHANAKNAADAVLKPILELQDEYKNEPIEVSTFRNNRLIRSAYTGFGFAANPSNRVYAAKTRLIHLYDPTTAFTAAATSANNQSVVADSRYLDEAAYTFSKGNLAEETPKSGVTTAYLWGYPNNVAIARITNAHNNEVAYTSFENGEQEGNWTISDNSRNTSGKVTGRRSYELSGGRSVTAGIPTGKQSVVSYWSMNGAATVSANGAPVAATPGGLSKGGWTYYEHTLPNTTTAVAVTGNGVAIDELRLYPAGAEMETWCYTPVTGMNSSCDKNSRIAYYEYDALGRLMLVRDQDGNIVKTYQYNYKQ